MKVRYKYLKKVTAVDVGNLNTLAQLISVRAKTVTSKTVRKLINEGNHLLVVRSTDTGEIVAMGTLIMQYRVTGTIARIEHVSVKIPQRRRGIATKMMGMLMRKASALGAERIDLGTGSKEAEALYRKLGFKHKDHEKVFWYTVTA